MSEQAERFSIKIPGAVDDPAWQTPGLSQEDQEKKAAVDAVLDPVERMKESHETKNLSLGEIKSRDEDNLALVLSKCREYRYPTLNHAIFHVGQFLGRAMGKLGVKSLADHGKRPMPQAYKGLTSIPGGLYNVGHTPSDEAAVTQEMVANDVRVEIRQPQMYPKAERWKSGIYLYHGNEIAFFISNPMIDQNTTGGDGHIIITHRNPKRFFVRTNAPKE